MSTMNGQNGAFYRRDGTTDPAIGRLRFGVRTSLTTKVPLGQSGATLFAGIGVR